MGSDYYHVECQDFLYNERTTHEMIQGYIVAIQRKAHSRCGCLRGRSLTLYRRHPPAVLGAWPMHYAVFEHLVSMELSGFTLLSHSYGLMRMDKIGLMFQHDDRFQL